jgi:hypothetical protein
MRRGLRRFGMEMRPANHPQAGYQKYNQEREERFSAEKCAFGTSFGRVLKLTIPSGFGHSR